MSKPYIKGFGGNGLNVLSKLYPKVRLLDDFFVFDVETGIDADYCKYEPCPLFKKLGLKQDTTVKTGISWLLDAKPNRLKFACIYGKNYNKVVYSAAELKAEFQHKRYKNKLVFAHNFGKYDGLVTFGSLYKADPNTLFNGTRFISMTNGNCKFADSLNVFVGQGVKHIGKQLGLHKLQLGESLFSPNGITDSEINYCFVDCRIIWEALYKSFEFAGDKKITQASLSLTCFRRKFLKYNIEWSPNVKHFYNSYYGGRCEVFKEGKTNSEVFDINSQYPRALIDTKFPNPKTLKIDDYVSVAKLHRLLRSFEGLAYCEILHPETDYGLLPYKKNGKLLFPVGNFSGCWNFNELRYAIERGCTVKNVFKTVYSEPVSSPFKEFVEEIYNLKLIAELDGNEFMRDLYKRYVNSLYGKFGQRINEKTIYIDHIEKRWELIQKHQREGTFINLKIFNSKRNDAYLVIKSERIDSHCIPSFAAYTTSTARIMLMQGFEMFKGMGITYCDTDSIFCERAINIKTSTELGGWKKENKIVTNIIAPKNYTFIKSKVKSYNGFVYHKENTIEHNIKGVPKKALAIGNDQYKYYNLLGEKEALKRGLEPGGLTKREKTISGTNDKRIVLPDGTTKPIKL